METSGLTGWRIRYRTKLLLGFVAVVAIVATASTWAGISYLSRTILGEAMRRVELDLGAAWSAFDAEKVRVATVVGMASQGEALRSALRSGTSPAPLRDLLESQRRRNGLDVLTLVDAGGKVVARSRPPYLAGDRVSGDPVVKVALEGAANQGFVVLSGEELSREGDDLAGRASIPLIYTERAVPTSRTVESSGLLVLAAVPVLEEGDRVLGAIVGGVLVNRQFEIVDRIRDVAFGSRAFEGRPVGTVTLFLGDVRVATNVMLDPSTRALGTRVSREVYEKVFVRGERFANRAFVVNDWYLSAYDPIRDPKGRVVGIIYVGLLEKVYLGYGEDLALRFLAISLLSVLLAVGASLYFSAGLRRPMLNLVLATRELSAGNLAVRVKIGRASREVTELADSFNAMAEALEGRNTELSEASQALERAYREAADRNRAYLETLGFVTHELKSPLASITFGVAALRDGTLGPLSGTQLSVLHSAGASADFLRDTIANYLNLSRIEEGALSLRAEAVEVRSGIVVPVFERLSELAAETEMRFENRVPAGLTVFADKGLLQSVFQNLLSNSIKYGRPGGRIIVEGEAPGDDGMAHFSVMNDGSGFLPEDADRLFRKFTRLAAGQETKSGTGLGLFVSKKIVESHGGRLWAESEPGAWARFSMAIPVRGRAGGQPS